MCGKCNLQMEGACSSVEKQNASTICNAGEDYHLNCVGKTEASFVEVEEGNYAAKRARLSQEEFAHKVRKQVASYSSFRRLS